MRRAVALLACGMVLVLASGVLASTGNPDVQLLSASVTFGGETCTIDNELSEIAVHWPGCAADEATSSCAPTVLPGEVILIVPEIACHGVESPFNVRFSWRRQDAASDSGFLVEEFDPNEPAASIQAAMDTTGLAPGCYIVTIWADSENAVFETEESNNKLAFSVRIEAPQPNLHPIALRLSAISPVERGETFMLHVEVLNIGEADAGRFAVHFLAAPAAVALPLCGSAVVQYLQPDGRMGSTVYVGDPADSAGLPCSAPESAGTTAPLSAWSRLGTVYVEGLARDGGRIVSISVDTDDKMLFPLERQADDDDEAVYVVQVLVDADLWTGTPVAPSSDSDSAEAENGKCSWASSGGTVQESSDGDNCIATSFQLVENWKRRADLKPITLTLTPPSPIEWRSSAIVQLTVANTGGRAPEHPTAVRYFIRSQGGSDADWRELGTYEVGRPDQGKEIVIAAGEPGIEQGLNTVTRNVRLNFDSDPGAYELRVIVDARDAEDEQSEFNNDLIIGFTIIGSELHPVGLSVASRRVFQGDSVAVSLDVVNTGEKPVADFTVGFFVDGIRKDTFYYSAHGEGDENRLAQGEAATATGFIDTMDLPVGRHVLRAVVDPDDRIAEVDEANNEISTTLEIEPPISRLPELQVEDVAIGTDAGSSFLAPAVIQATVINRGDLAAEGVSVDLFTRANCFCCLSGGFDPAGGESYWIDRLEPGQRHVATWQLTSPLPEGRLICVVIDGTNEIKEWDDLNNALILGYTPTEVVPLGTNLTCRIDSVQPSTSVDPGVTVTIIASVINGGLESVGPFRVDFQWMDPYGAVHRLETQVVDSLSAGRSISIPYSVDTHHFPPGLHQAIVQVDVNDEVNEVNENDNQCNGIIQIGPPELDCHADLVPVSVRFDSPGSTVGDDNTVERNQPLYVYVTVRNDGCIPSGQFAVAFETSLGVETEQWTGIGAQDQIEVSHPVPTGTSGTFDLIIDVDPDNRVYEGTSDSSAERNNRIPNQYIPDLPVYNVAAASPPRPERMIPPDPDDSGIAWSDSPARWLAADTGSQHVYVVWEDGDIGRIRVDDDAASRVAQLAVAVTDVEMTFGSVPYAYVAAADGSFQRVNLETGTTVGEADLGGGILAIALGDGGRVYAAVENGFYELRLSGSSYLVSQRVPVSRDVIDIQYDSSRQLIYVLSATGLHVYGIDLAARCLFDQGETVGVPAVFTLGGSGNYLGTSAGSGAILYALSHCTSTGDGSGHILAGWRYPRTGSLPGTITSVIIDPRDIDPIYAATRAGSLYSLGFDGTPQWVYEAGAAIRSIPLADKRTGRIFFGDDDGIPHILTLAGVDAFEIDLTGYSARAIRSTLVIVETRERTDFGTRLFRNYYYGREDGAVYKIASQQ